MKLKFGFDSDPDLSLGPTLKGPSLKKSSKFNKYPAGSTPPNSTFIPAFGSQTNKLESVKELQRLVGLQNVKSLIEEIVAYVKIERKRQQEGLLTEPMVLHMIFRGNPGTGKTTVARLMGRLLRELGVLQKGHLIELERADLVGEYVGHTAQRTREQIRKSLGGVMFIDEAYSLARGGSRDFGREAIDTLVKSMEDYRKDMVLILAGYKNEMDNFLASNPGLRSRFPIHLSFPDFTVSELMDIARLMVEDRQYRFAPEAEAKLETIIRQSSNTGHPFGGNARFVRNIVEKAIRTQALRLVKHKTLSREQLILLEACDIPDETYRIEGNECFENEKLANLEVLKRMRSARDIAATEG